MSNVVLNFESKPTNDRLRCTGCGATTEAPCDCGVPYALLKPKAVAEIGIKETPQLSNKEIARRMGVSATTVNVARRELSHENRAFEPPESFWTPERDAELLRLFRAGKRGKELSEIFGVTVGAASGRAYRLDNIRPDLEERMLPPQMPDDIHTQLFVLASQAKARMYEIDKLSTYVDQMHEDTRQLFAQEVEIVYNLSREIIRRLVGGTRNIKAPVACGVPVKLRKED